MPFILLVLVGILQNQLVPQKQQIHIEDTIEEKRTYILLFSMHRQSDKGKNYSSKDILRTTFFFST